MQILAHLDAAAPKLPSIGAASVAWPGTAPGTALKMGFQYRTSSEVGVSDAYRSMHYINKCFIYEDQGIRHRFICLVVLNLMNSEPCEL